jgi:hypothetical protein
MKNTDYDPDFSHMVSERRKVARLALIGYGAIIFVIAILSAALVATTYHFLIR